ncbi:hypothetical protein VFC49_02840 [Thermococcus sp. SY098]|uniref:hypothetical protein n=1 Tax=Thermococcus sp. SY098 TaxID=3111325 RepID=UPI002D7914AE|nr:hypothetical protein [Thermococcus sp. SY098]WRS53090.1 hypothetical protein VFC49_02840 [Thermococcus sp. SY098]
MLYAGIAAATILFAIWITRYLGEEYAWVNRKIIHFSIVPAVLFYNAGLIAREIFAAAAFLFGAFQLFTHIKKDELSWYQIKNNYGEVFFAFSAAAVAWFIEKEYAVVILLVMAISDGVTGILRFFYFKAKGFNVRLRKHWIGSLGYLISAVIIVAIIFPQSSIVSKVIWAGILTLAEYQRFLDDNLAVPLVGVLIKGIL